MKRLTLIFAVLCACAPALAQTTATAAPTSDESVTGSWTGSVGSRYALVNDYADTTPNTVLTTPTASGGAQITFGFAAFSIPSNATSILVQVLYHDVDNTSGTNNASGRLKVGGSYYNATTHSPSGTTLTAHSDNWATNPKTAAAWTAAQINGTDGTNDLQAFGFNSTDASPAINFSDVQLQIAYTLPLAACTTAPCPTSALNDIETTPSVEPSSPLPNNFKLTFPNPVGLHNLLVCGISWLGSTITLNTPTDSQSNTWGAAVTATGTRNEGNGIVKTALYYAPNANAGVTTVTFVFSSATQAHFRCSEFYNVATSTPLDAAVGTPDIQSSGTAVTVAAGSQTTTVDNDLIVYYAVDIDGPIGGFGIITRPTSYTSAGGWTKLAGNYSSGIFSEYLVWGSHGAINPAMVVNSSGSNTNTFNAVAASFKAATAGTAPPAGIRIDHLVTLQTDSAATYTIEFPCTGNLIVFTCSEGTGQDNYLSTVPSADGHNFTAITDDAAHVAPQMAYWANASPTANTMVTLHHASFQGGSQALYCISGAATAPVDPSVTCNSGSTLAGMGSCIAGGTNNGSAPNAPNIRPSTSNGLIIGIFGNGVGPESTVASPVIFDNVPYTNETDNGQMNSGDARSHYFNPNTSAVNFSYTVPNNGNTWNGRATAFTAPAASGVRKRVIVTRE